MDPQTYASINLSLMSLQVDILKLLSNETFISELSGEDEVMFGTFLDFILRLDEEHMDKSGQVPLVVESPEQWREQQDAETDGHVPAIVLPVLSVLGQWRDDPCQVPLLQPGGHRPSLCKLSSWGGV